MLRWRAGVGAGVVAAALCLALAQHGGMRAPALEGVALLAALGLALVDARRLPPLAWPALGAAAMALVALLPLPRGLRHALAPAATDLYALVTAPRAWAPLGVAPEVCGGDALRLAAVAALACVAASLAREERARVWLRAAALAGVALMAAATLAGALGVGPPLLAPRGKALLPSLLVNANHTGAFWALTLPILIALLRRADGLARRSGPEARRLIERAGVAGLIVVGNLALATTLSRGATVVGVAAQLLVLWLALAGARARRRRLVVGLAALVGATAVAAPVLLKLRVGVAAVDSLRWPLWRAVWPLVGDHLWLGVGRGSFPAVLTRYTPLAARNQFDFVENEALQTLVDGGVVGAVVVLGLALLAARALWRRRVAGSELASATLVGLGALALCNLFDFSWEMPALALSAVAWGALAAPEAGPRVSPWLLRAAALALAAAALWRLAAPPARAPSAPASGELEAYLADAEAWMARHPADGQVALEAASALAARGEDAAAWLERALLLMPFDDRPRLMAARTFAAHGARDAAEAQLRAAVASGRNRPDTMRVILTLFGGEPQVVTRIVGDDADALTAAINVLTEAPTRWPATAAALAARRLAADPDNLDAAQLATLAALAADDAPEAIAGARRWLRLAPAQVRGVVQRLLLAHRAAEAATLLADSDAAERAPTAWALASFALVDSGAVPVATASARVEAALARAVDSADKRELHLALAWLAERAGDPLRAAAERRRARDTR